MFCEHPRNHLVWPTGKLKSITLGVLLVLCAGILPAGNAQALSGPMQSTANIIRPCTSWPVVPSPNVGIQGSTLLATSAISPSNVWAVGYNGYQSGSALTLIEHWDGATWTVASSPNTTGQRNVLESVTAISASDVWAVGYSSGISTSLYQTLIEHWNGSTWSIVSSPNPGSFTDTLSGVAASSSTDIWAVGMQGTNTTSGSLIEHWNGTTWQVVSNPSSPPPLAQLQSVSVISSTDAWAVGNYEDNTGHHTLAEHWNGTSWQAVSTPDGSQSGNNLYAVTAISASDVWAVGAYENPVGPNALTLIEHWNGSSWTMSASPNPGNGDNLLNAVVAVNPSSVWAAGTYTVVTSSSTALTLIEQWNGSSWSVVCSNSRGIGNSALAGLAVTNSQVWAVGYWVDSNYLDETLVEVYLTSFPIWIQSRHGRRPLR